MQHNYNKFNDIYNPIKEPYTTYSTYTTYTPPYTLLIEDVTWNFMTDYEGYKTINLRYNYYDKDVHVYRNLDQYISSRFARIKNTRYHIQYNTNEQIVNHKNVLFVKNENNNLIYNCDLTHLNQNNLIFDNFLYKYKHYLYNITTMQYVYYEAPYNQTVSPKKIDINEQVVNDLMVIINGTVRKFLNNIDDKLQINDK